MDSVNKWLTPLNTAFIIALFVVVLVGGNQPVPVNLDLGASTPGTRFPHGITIGGTWANAADTGQTNIAKKIIGTCANPYPTITQGGGTDNLSFSATSSLQYECAVTGVISGDVVQAWFTSKLPSWDQSRVREQTTEGGLSFEIGGVRASSTSGYIVFDVLNRTPATTSIGVASSSVQYDITRTQ